MINHFFMLCKLLFKIILLGKTMRITIWINTLNVFLPYYSTLLIWIFDQNISSYLLGHGKKNIFLSADWHSKRNHSPLLFSPDCNI
jgi:hypothetical protein